jgi:TetR/AcrR family transcriptional regulator, tetracycline repressor protein
MMDSDFSGPSNVTQCNSATRPRGRPPLEKPLLSRKVVLKAALSLLDAKGLAAISMRVLAGQLGVTPMSFYNHFSDKSALLDALHEAVLLDVVPSRLFPAGPWKAMAIAMARTLRVALRAHPNALMLFATRPMRTPALLQAADGFLGVLLDAGFTSRKAMYLLDSIGMFTVGHAMAEFGASSVAAPERNGEDLHAERAALEKYELHNLLRVVTENRPHDYEAEYEMGLQAILDGFEVQRSKRDEPNVTTSHDSLGALLTPVCEHFVCT